MYLEKTIFDGFTIPFFGYLPQILCGKLTKTKTAS